LVGFDGSFVWVAPMFLNTFEVQLDPGKTLAPTCRPEPAVGSALRAWFPGGGCMFEQQLGRLVREIASKLAPRFHLAADAG
jgi:hypothetical protein